MTVNCGSDTKSALVCKETVYLLKQMMQAHTDEIRPYFINGKLSQYKDTRTTFRYLLDRISIIPGHIIVGIGYEYPNHLTITVRNKYTAPLALPAP